MTTAATPPAPPASAYAKERAHPRVLARVSAELDTFRDRFTAVTHDLSLGGAGLELDRPLEEGAALSVSLFLVVDDVEDESTASMLLRGRVAWCAESDTAGRFSAGIRFDDLLPHQQAGLARYLQAITGK